MIAEGIYALCVVSSAFCAWILLRAYRRTRTELLFWSGLCFVGLTVDNVLVFFDIVVLPTQIDLSAWRLISALTGISLLCYGLIREAG